MQYSIEEMTTWSISDIEREIRKLLPPEWTFGTAVKDGWHGAELRNGVSEPQWVDWQADRRLVLLNCFGWLWMRNHKTLNPAWRVRRGEINVQDLRNRRPAQRVPRTYGAPVSDPEDLDPEHVHTVYGGRRER